MSEKHTPLSSLGEFGLIDHLTNSFETKQQFLFLRGLFRHLFPFFVVAQHIYLNIPFPIDDLFFRHAILAATKFISI